MAKAPAFKLTYSTMFDPPSDLHRRFEEALRTTHGATGASHPMWIGGRAVEAARTFDVVSPIDTRRLLGRFQTGEPRHVEAALAAASRAFRPWAATPWPRRIELLQRAATLIEERVYQISAALALEVGKNRMEALGEVQETADLIRWYCDQMQANDGFDRVLPNDPLPGFTSRNRTVMKPLGPWVVIAPFNFPIALAGGPIAAALVTGNTVVFKVASSTAWSGWLLMQALRDAGLPDGVVNYLTGSGSELGAALIHHPAVAGVTFTGSTEVGLEVVRTMAGGRWPRPAIVEMGGKNAAIVTRHADLDAAATGISRSAFGLSGQKCSACSRVYVERPVAAALRERLVARAQAISVGDPTEQRHWMGPVIDEQAAWRFQKCSAMLREHGRIDTGGVRLADGDHAHGWFVAPTIGSAAFDYRLWREEKFIPLLLVGEVDELEQALTLANDSDYGLTAGFYGAPDEIPTFLDRIEAGVTYVNRPQGATTGAWPGYQPFGGWKGSGSTGKAIGSFWYLPLYMREQSQTVVGF